MASFGVDWSNRTVISVLIFSYTLGYINSHPVHDVDRWYRLSVGSEHSIGSAYKYSFPFRLTLPLNMLHFQVHWFNQWAKKVKFGSLNFYILMDTTSHTKNVTWEHNTRSITRVLIGCRPTTLEVVRNFVRTWSSFYNSNSFFSLLWHGLMVDPGHLNALN